MSNARFSRRHTRNAALLTVASAALVTTTACASGLAPGHVGAASFISSTAVADALAAHAAGAAPATSAAPAASAAPATTAAAAPSPAAPVATHTTKSPAVAGKAAGAKTAVPACGNDDLAIGNGYGTQSYPVQDSSIVITNVGNHTCTLQGYIGAAIVVDGRTINAARALNLDRGTLPELTSPPLVTLAPGASSYSVLQWVAGKGPGCYPTGTGLLEATAPNTTRTVVPSKAVIMGGDGGICSGFEVDPVTAGYFGTPVGVPARN